MFFIVNRIFFNLTVTLIPILLKLYKSLFICFLLKVKPEMINYSHNKNMFV